MKNTMYKPEKFNNMDIHKFLVKNGIDNVVINAKEFPENTVENAKKWVYLSDKFIEFAKTKWFLTENQLPNNDRVVLNQDGYRCFYDGSWHIEQMYAIGKKVSPDEIIAWCELPTFNTAL